MLSDWLCDCLQLVCFVYTVGLLLPLSLECTRRFEFYRRWIEACDTCHGWVLVTDARDVIIQVSALSAS